MDQEQRGDRERNQPGIELPERRDREPEGREHEVGREALEREDAGLTQRMSARERDHRREHHVVRRDGDGARDEPGGRPPQLLVGDQPVRVQHDRGCPPRRQVAERVVADVEALDVPGVAFLEPLRHVHHDTHRAQRAPAAAAARSESGRPTRCGTPCSRDVRTTYVCEIAAPATRIPNVVHFDVATSPSRSRSGRAAAVAADPGRDTVGGSGPAEACGDAARNAPRAVHSRARHRSGSLSFAEASPSAPSRAGRSAPG